MGVFLTPFFGSMPVERRLCVLGFGRGAIPLVLDSVTMKSLCGH